jgi:hypothetical protein
MHHPAPQLIVLWRMPSRGLELEVLFSEFQLPLKIITDRRVAPLEADVIVLPINAKQLFPWAGLVEGDVNARAVNVDRENLFAAITD